MNTPTPAPEHPEQLALPLRVPAAPARRTGGSVVVPLKFRVSEATARRGLQHVAELRELLNERQAARDAARQSHRPTAA